MSVDSQLGNDERGCVLVMAPWGPRSAMRALGRRNADILLLANIRQERLVGSTLRLQSTGPSGVAGPEAPKAAIDHLRTGGTVATFAAVDTSRSTPNTTLLGQPSALPVGPAAMSRITGASIVPVTVGWPDGGHLGDLAVRDVVGSRLDRDDQPLGAARVGAGERRCSPNSVATLSCFLGHTSGNHVAGPLDHRPNAASHIELSVVVEAPDVTGVEPSVSQNLCRGVGIVEVAGEEPRTQTCPGGTEVPSGRRSQERR